MNHDSSYHALFSNPDLVEDLLKNFVDEDFIRQFNFSTLHRENTKLHGRKLKKREGDIIYSIETLEGVPAYLYLFLEFQSSADKWMPIRITDYICLFYQQLEKQKRFTPKGLLPPVFSIVIYNGKTRWRYPTSTHSLIDLPPKHSLWKYQIDAQFYLIDETRFPQGKRDSLSGILFKLENATTQAEVIDAIYELSHLLKTSKASAGLKRAFNDWVRFVVEPYHQIELQLEQIEDLAENRAMLRERIQQWKKEAINQGLEEGRQEGRQVGRQEGLQQGQLAGQRATLKKLISLRFQAPPDWAVERIDSATERELDEWTGRILSLDSLEGILAPLEPIPAATPE